MAPGSGIEPVFVDSKTTVLPLDDPGMVMLCMIIARLGEPIFRCELRLRLRSEVDLGLGDSNRRRSQRCNLFPFCRNRAGKCCCSSTYIAALRNRYTKINSSEFPLTSDGVQHFENLLILLSQSLLWTFAQPHPENQSEL